jgi:hypothetical protein
MTGSGRGAGKGKISKVQQKGERCMSNEKIFTIELTGKQLYYALMGMEKIEEAARKSWKPEYAEELHALSRLFWDAALAPYRAAE